MKTLSRFAVVHLIVFAIAFAMARLGSRSAFADSVLNGTISSAAGEKRRAPRLLFSAAAKRQVPGLGTGADVPTDQR